MGIKRYDPLKAPDPAQWLAMDEQERISLAQEYHRRANIRLPSVEVHAMAHAIVENQIALGGEIPVRRTVQRLMAEGLDRHEAIHAVGMILMEFIHGAMTRAEKDRPEHRADPNPPYCAALERLTAESWRRSK